ncbi:MAG: O-antigen ligase family protein, partial [Kiritimatiellae bacterium]|nr:O-antigen ligase family protein [Kiritimatiellia bacterium]
MTFFFTFLFVLLVFWRPQEWLVPWLYGFPLLDVVTYVALLALLIEVDSGKLEIPRSWPQTFLIPGLWVAACMSHVANTYYEGLVESIVPAFKLCLFTLLMFCVLDDVFRLRIISNTIVLMACVMAIHALMQERVGYGFAGHRPLHLWGEEGLYFRTWFFGIFEDPNDLAQMLATAIPLSFCLTKRRTPWGFLLGCGIATLLVMAILSTRSRGGLVALVAVSAVMVALVMPARWLPTLMVMMLVGALVMCPLSTPFLEESAHDRVVFWGTANRVFKTKPLFGVGFGMFNEYIPGDRAAHNAFVLCYTELGLFGYWFWFAMIQLGLLGAWRTRVTLREYEGEEEGWLYRFSGLAIAAMVGFCASAYFLTRAYV